MLIKGYIRKLVYLLLKYARGILTLSEVASEAADLYQRCGMAADISAQITENAFGKLEKS